MAKNSVTYICSPSEGGCGATLTREALRCPRCKTIGSVIEDSSGSGASSQAGLKSSGAATPTKQTKTIRELQGEPVDRFSTGIGELDRVLGGGFVNGSVVLLGGQPGSGKALKSDTLIPLATGGFKQLSEVLPGDKLIDNDGISTEVVNTLYPDVDRAFRLTFDNGSTVEACEDHIWTLLTPASVNAKWYETPEVENITTSKLFQNFQAYVDNGTYPTLEHNAVQSYPERQLQVSPYHVGVLLGGGAKHYNATFGDLQNTLQKYQHYDTQLQLNHIPKTYLFSSVEQRRAVLQGFIETTGQNVSKKDTDIVLPSLDLLPTFRLLLDSLGMPYETYQKNGKHILWIRDPHFSSRLTHIVNIEEIPVETDDTYICLMVDSPSQTFRFGKHYIVTHNSTVSMSIAEKFAEKDFTVLYSSGEESERQIYLRAKRMGVDNDNIHIVNETNLESLLGHIEAVQPNFVIVDSLQTLASTEVTGSVGSTSQSLECAHALTRVAKSRGITMLLINQVTKS